MIRVTLEIAHEEADRPTYELHRFVEDWDWPQVVEEVRGIGDIAVNNMAAYFVHEMLENDPPGDPE